MSSKRILSLATSQVIKKPRKTDAKPLKMRELVSNIEGGGGGGANVKGGPAVLGVHSPASLPTCLHLTSPTKSPLDKKEYRVIQLENGLTALLISDASRIMTSPEEEDDSEDDDYDEEQEASSGDEELEDEDGVEEEDEEDIEGVHSERSGKDSTKYLAAASLTVGVGSFEDPLEIPGLMHFLEHMVFMGSEKYPKENAFDYYIKKHGGRDNAHTDMEHTTFYFEVQESYFHEGLDRFAHFFINPLMKQETMAREREAVHSEFQMASPEIDHRIQQLFASFAADGHPMGKFTWGNETTLNTGIPDEELHKKLHELRLKYYSSHYMTLAVQARLTLDTLQEYVSSIFSKIPRNNIPRPTYSHLEFPFPMENLHRLYHVVTTKEHHCLEIRWVLPSLFKYYQTKPLHYVSHLIGHEGRGSILSYLKKKVWAVGLYSGNDESGFDHNTACAIMSIFVELTDEGFKNIDEVLCIVFQYVAMIQQVGPIERIFKEIQQISQIDFDYAEECSTIENVENISEAMQLFPPEDYLTGDCLMKEYNPQIIKECLDALVPEKCNIIISSKTVAEKNLCLQVEKWFQTKYSVEDIPKAWKDQWANLQPNSELHIPAPSNFIPDNFDLLTTEEEVPDYPQKLYEDEYGVLWYKPDQKFKLPRTYCYVYLITELPQQSPRLAALLDLFLKLFQQQVMEDIYPASMAQYYFSLSATERGLVMKMNGFNQKLPQLLDLLLHHMETFEDHLNEKTFQGMKQQQMKSYHYALLKPDFLCKDTRLSILQQIHWTAHQKLLETKDLSSKDLLEEFVAKLFPTSFIRVLIQGNTSASEAIDMYNMVKARKEKQVCTEKSPFPELRTMELSGGCWIAQLNGLNPANTNSYVVNYYQYKEGTLALEVLLEFIQMVMDEPVFDILRTKEQLGYHVYCTNHDTFGILGLSVTVNTQANKFSVSHVDKRIEAFLKEFVNTLKNLKETELSELKETLTNMKQTIDLTLGEEVSRNWSEIVNGEYVFDRLKRQIELIKSITHESIVECIEQITSSKDNPRYRKLSVQVIGTANPKEESTPSLTLMGQPGFVSLLAPSGDSPEKNSPPEQFITDIVCHKEKLRMYPVTKIL